MAHAVIGVNTEAGVIYFVDIASAFEAAKSLWKVAKPSLDELPQLRQISDIAWGIWRRKHPDGQNLGRINKVLVDYVVNDITRKLIAKALKTYRVEDGHTRETSVPLFPGITFSMDTEQGAAMLGK